MRRKKKAKRKVTKRCVCKKQPNLANMKLSTLRKKAKQIDSAISRKTTNLGVVKRTKT